MYVMGQNEESITLDGLHDPIDKSLQHIYGVIANGNAPTQL